MPATLQISLIALVLAASAHDIRWRKIPNWLSLSGVIVGFGMNVLFFHAQGLKIASLGFGLALLVYLPLYLVRGMGAGDVKLMAAVGSIAGPENWVRICVATVLIGGIASLVYVVGKGRFRQTIFNLFVIVRELAGFRLPSNADPALDFRHTKSLRLPHGAVIAAGVVAFLVMAGSI